MYWQKANGEAWGTLHALLADINSQGQVQMAMNGGIYGSAVRKGGNQQLIYLARSLSRVWRSS